MICNLCPRKCNALRDENNANGFCRMTTRMKVARIAPHKWEEPCISGKSGSGAVFFSGCTMRCVFCQNHEISAMGNGRYITEYKLSEKFRELESLGVHNIELVTATQYLPAVIKSLDIYKPKIPLIWNSSGFERVSTLKMLDGYIDVYLPDFKYSNDILAKQYSNAEHYTDTATNAIREMIRQRGTPQFNGELITSGVIIRHLVLPNHTKNSIGVLDIIAEEFKDTALVSLMGQYLPTARANEFENLCRKITRREYDKVLSHLLALGLDGYSQELKSADEKYIPIWDYD